MSLCPSATYDSADSAKSARKALTRRWNFPVSVYQCQTCDNYHLRANASKLHVPKRALEVLRFMALGYTNPEISGLTGITFRTVEWYVAVLKDAFGALSAPHLIFIATAFNILDPREAVPPLTERNHADDDRAAKSANSIRVAV